MWRCSEDTPPCCKNGNNSNNNKKVYCSYNVMRNRLTYLSPGLVVSLSRRDLITALTSAGCGHLAVKIFRYLDSVSLLACSLVCTDWQRMLLAAVYTAPKFRRRVRSAVFGGGGKAAAHSQIRLTLEDEDESSSSSSIVDVAIDHDFNLFVLSVNSRNGGGGYSIMSCSLFGRGKKRWVHSLEGDCEDDDDDDICCISAGHSVVALGCRSGKVLVYECLHRQQRRLARVAVLSYHSRAVRSIVFAAAAADTASFFYTCSDDMTVGAVEVSRRGRDKVSSSSGCAVVVRLARLLHGHVSRVRAIDAHGGRFVLSGSDDRSVKLWTLSKEAAGKPLVSTLTGHSGPVTCVQLALPLAMSAAGSAVRLWDAAQGTCLKLLQHEQGCAVGALAWISTFKGAATVDANGRLRCFDLVDLETTNHEIVVASTITRVNNSSNNGSSSPSSIWSDHAVFRLESVPHHFVAVSIANTSLPAVTVHCLDYVY